MAQKLTQTRDGSVTTLTLDDGKVNALSPAMLAEIDAALERAKGEGTAVVITGRPGVFSAGFDLQTLRAGGDEAVAMFAAGARLAARMLSHPAPVLSAVNGPAIAMGAFVALAADLRIAAAQPTLKIAANEVAIGLTLPRFAVALLRGRLAPPHFARAAILAHEHGADEALGVGWVNELVPPGELLARAHAAARRLADLPREAFAATKIRVHAPMLAELSSGLEADVADWRTRLGPGPA